MTFMVKGTFASECRTIFWPTRFTYSVIIGSSMNLAWRSTSAAASRPILTSFSVDPLIFAMIPLLMLRLPIMSGFSLVDNGLLLCGGVVAAVTGVAVVAVAWV